jgi:hypothetical protein
MAGSQKGDETDNNNSRTNLDFLDLPEAKTS